MHSWDPPETLLTRLFIDLFATDELRAWLRQHFPDEVSCALPGAVASPQAVAQAASELLLRRGEVADLWPRLCEARPRRADHIRGAQAEVTRLMAAHGREGAPAPASRLPAVRCQRCGIEAEADQPCLGLAPTHDFVEFSGDVFCRDCGVHPGGPRGACTGGRASHRFVAAACLPRCRRCGRQAGDRSHCAGLAPQHEFLGE